MAGKAPGRAHREGLTLVEVMDMFRDEDAAREWFESVVWPNGRRCGKCGGADTREVPNRKPMPYWCRGCRSYFSVRTNTPIARSNVPLRKWAIAVYLCLTSLKGVSSMKLHRDLGVSQPTAWFMLHRIREAWALDGGDDHRFEGPVEVDETYVGGRQANMRRAKRAALPDGGTAHLTAVVGVRDRARNEVRAQVVRDTTAPTLQGFVRENTEPGAAVYTDEHRSYIGLKRDYAHGRVRHGVGEYVDGMIHINGMESFWSTLKRAHKGVFHKLSPKHLQRYADEFAGRQRVRDAGTLAQMRGLVAGLVGRNLLRRDLVADNGLASGARSA